jgi:hypothetical protein
MSAVAFWFSVLRRGRVEATQPMILAFVKEPGTFGNLRLKVFLRTLLVSTGKRGNVIESLYLRIKQGNQDWELSFWGYGEKDLVRGAGLFVPESGFATYHHFSPIGPLELLRLSSGPCSVRLMAKVLNQGPEKCLWKVDLLLPQTKSEDFGSIDEAVYFDWAHGERQYTVTVEKRKSPITNPWANDGLR